MANVLIAGCGYVGTALGERLAAQGHIVYGMRRDVGALPASIRPLAADLSDPASLNDLPHDLNTVYYAVSAQARDDAAYVAAYLDGPRNLMTALSPVQGQLRRLVFVSSTSVYHQQDGEEVDETSPTEPTAFNGRRVLEAERQLLASGWHWTVVRLAGIYGPGRARLVQRVQAGEFSQGDDARRILNHVHRDDCAGILAHVGELDPPEACYVGADHEPATVGAIERWLAARLGIPAPPEPAGPGLGKRCLNRRLLASGYRFAFPTFREGYEGLLASAD